MKALSNIKKNFLFKSINVMARCDFISRTKQRRIVTIRRNYNYYGSNSGEYPIDESLNHLNMLQRMPSMASEFPEEPKPHLSHEGSHNGHNHGGTFTKVIIYHMKSQSLNSGMKLAKITIAKENTRHIMLQKDTKRSILLSMQRSRKLAVMRSVRSMKRRKLST